MNEEIKDLAATIQALSRQINFLASKYSNLDREAVTNTKKIEEMEKSIVIWGTALIKQEYQSALHWLEMHINDKLKFARKQVDNAERETLLAYDSTIRELVTEATQDVQNEFDRLTKSYTKRADQAYDRLKVRIDNRIQKIEDEDKGPG